MLRAASFRSQSGISLIGLLIWAIIVAFVALIVVRVLPTINEYTTVLRTVKKIAQEQPGTVAEARKAFDRQRDIEYSISSVSGQDLQVTKENDKVVIRFEYNKEVPIFEPVYLLIKYEGESK